MKITRLVLTSLALSVAFAGSQIDAMHRTATLAFAPNASTLAFAPNASTLAFAPNASWSMHGWTEAIFNTFSSSRVSFKYAESVTEATVLLKRLQENALLYNAFIAAVKNDMRHQESRYIANQLGDFLDALLQENFSMPDIQKMITYIQENAEKVQPC